MPHLYEYLAQPRVADLKASEVAVYATLVNVSLRRRSRSIVMSIRRRSPSAGCPSLQDLLPPTRPGAAMHHESIGQALRGLRAAGLLHVERRPSPSGAKDGPGTPYQFTVQLPRDVTRPAWGLFNAVLLTLLGQRHANARE